MFRAKNYGAVFKCMKLIIENIVDPRNSEKRRLGLYHNYVSTM